MVGAGAGVVPTNWAIITTAGLTVTVLAPGVESGLPYTDIQLSGTSSGTFFDLVTEVNNAIPAAQAQAWTPSVFLRLMAGSLANVVSFQLGAYTYTSVPGFLNSYGVAIASPTGAGLATQRMIGNAMTMVDATTGFIRPRIIVNVTNASAIALTLRIGAPQIEKSPIAHAWIPTSGAAAGSAPTSVGYRP